MTTIQDLITAHQATGTEITVRNLSCFVVAAFDPTEGMGQRGPYTRQGCRLRDDSGQVDATIWDGRVQQGEQITVQEGKLSTRTAQNGKQYTGISIPGGKFLVQPAGTSGVAARPSLSPMLGGSLPAPTPSTGTLSFDEYWQLYEACLRQAERAIGLKDPDAAGPDWIMIAKDMATSAMIAYVKDRAFERPAKAPAGEEPPPDFDAGATDDSIPF